MKSVIPKPTANNNGGNLGGDLAIWVDVVFQQNLVLKSSEIKIRQCAYFSVRF